MKIIFTLFAIIVIITSCREVQDLEPNSPPKAIAGYDLTVEKGAKVLLDAASSTDKDGDPLFYSWNLSSKPKGSFAYIESPDASKASFIADTTGVYTVRLTVFDGIQASVDSLNVISKYTAKLMVSTLTDKVTSPIFGTLGPDGNLYISSYTGNIIYKVTPAGTVSTFAGSGTTGYLDGKVATAQFKNPAGLTFDALGNLYVADYGNHCIRKINTSSVVSTFAGYPQAGYLDAIGGQAQFNGPSSIVMDSKGDFFVSDIGNIRIRKITSAAVVSTFAGVGKSGFLDTTGLVAMFKSPVNLAIDATNNLYVADGGNYRVRKINPQALVTTIAGTDSTGYLDGVSSKAKFGYPYGVATGNNSIFIADYSINRIRLLSNNMVSTYAGTGASGAINGLASSATFNAPTGVIYDKVNNILYVLDFGNNMIRVVKYQ